MSGYDYQGDPADSRSMELTAVKVNTIDQYGLWVTVWDEESMECELLIQGLTPAMLLDALADMEN